MKRIMLFGIVMLLLTSMALARDVGHGETLDSSDVDAHRPGIWIKPHRDLTLDNVTKHASATGGSLFIVYNNNSVYHGEDFSGGQVVDLSDDNLVLKNNTLYLFAVGGHGETHTFRFSSGAPTYPIVRAEFNWVTGGSFQTGNTTTNASNIYQLLTIGVTNITTQSNFSLSATNLQNGTAIDTFNATVNGVFYSTTTGSITTNINATGSLANITVQSDSYIDRTFTNHNTSTDLGVTLWQAVTTFNATQAITGDLLTGVNFSTSWEAGNTIRSNNGNINVTTLLAGYYSKVATITANGISQQNITGMFNAFLNITAKSVLNGSSISEFTVEGVVINGSDSYRVNVSTTTGTAALPLLQSYRYNVSIFPVNFALGEKVINVTSASQTHEFSLYSSNSFNLTFKHEITDTLVSANFSVEFISDVASYNYTASNGELFVSLITPSNYTIRYSHPSYGRQRQYLVKLTSQSHQDLDLYVLDSGNSTAITASVFDQSTLNPQEGAVIYLQRYFPLSNTYKTVNMYTTDVAGKAYFDVEADNELYKFRVDRPWLTNRLSTIGQYLSATSYNLYISLQEAIGGSFLEERGIVYSLYYNNNTGAFTVSWEDSGLVATEYCLYVKQNQQYSKNTINSSCVTTNSGEISLKGASNASTNFASFVVTINGKTRTLSSIWADVLDDVLSVADAGKTGLLMTAIFFMTFVFVSAISEHVLIIGTVSLIFSKYLGFLSIGWGWIIGLLIASIIVYMVINNKR